MSLCDTVADMLTRIRNAVRNNASSVDCRNSKICAGIAKVLQDEGYINGYSVIDNGHQGILRIELRYGSRGEQVINVIRSESKQGCRVYKGVSELPRPLGGLGISVVSTSRGVLSDRQAREHNVGGELICTVE